MTPGSARRPNFHGGGGALGKGGQPAILLFRSADAIKQENGAWRPLRDYSGDFT